MVKDKGVDGKKALGVWFQRCNVEMVGVEVRTFKRLLSSIVESTMMYGAEVWGCNRNVETLQQVQLKAARLFLVLAPATQGCPCCGSWETCQWFG